MGGPRTIDPVVRRRRTPEPRWWNTWVWWLVSVLAALLHNGLWATPNLAFVALIARNPSENPFTGELAGDYLLTDVSLTRLAWVTAQTEPHEVARLHLAVLVLGWAAVVALTRRRFGHRVATTLTVVLAASPLVTVSMQWLGQPDPLTGLCAIAMVVVRRRWAVLALGFLAGITHPEQALFAAGVAGIIRCFLPEVDDDTDESRPRVPGQPVKQVAASLSAALGGVVAGWAAVQLWFLLADITLRTPRTDYLDYGPSVFAEHHMTEPLRLLWTLWGPLWLVLAALVVTGVRRGIPGARAWGLMGLFAVLALVPVFFTLDETRVYAVVTAALLPAAAVWIPQSWNDSLLRNASIALLVLTAVIPGGFATGSTSWRTQLDTPAMAAFLVDGSIDTDASGEPAMTPWLLSPFDFEIPDPPQ